MNIMLPHVLLEHEIENMINGQLFSFSRPSKQYVRDKSIDYSSLTTKCPMFHARHMHRSDWLDGIPGTTILPHSFQHNLWWNNLGPRPMLKTSFH